MLNVKIFQFNPLQENTYVLFNNQGHCIIIDPGCYADDERDQLTGFITDKALKPLLLLNTHCHLDHVFGNKYVAETYGLELFIHQGEQIVLDRAPESGLMWNMPFDNYAGKINYLEPGQQIGIDADQLDILFTPGHSPASVSLYAAAQGYLFAGDVLFRESVGRTDLPGASPVLLQKSIQEVLYTLPDQTTVYPGHGMPTTIGHEKKYNPFVKG